MSREDSRGGFTIQRRYKAFNRIFQIALVILLGLLLNMIASKQFVRTHLKPGAATDLSPETKFYLRNLSDDIQAIVLVGPSDDGQSGEAVYDEIASLLREFEYTCRDGNGNTVTAEFVDVYKDRARAAEIAAEHGIDTPGSILLYSGGRRRLIDGSQLYKTEEEEVLFNGEAAFMEAVLDVSNEDQVKVYYIEGHGEKSPRSTDPAKGLSAMSTMLRERNILTASLNLSDTGDIPEDASAVILADPQVPLLPYEEGILERYIGERGGRLLVFTRPGANTGISELLMKWGILLEDRIIVSVDGNFQSDTGNTILRRFAEHPITDFLRNNNHLLLAGLCRSVRVDPAGENDDTLRITPIVTSSGPDPESGKVRSWGETDWIGAVNIKYNSDRDIAGPVGIALLAEKQAGSELGLDIPEGKLFVMGNSDICSNQFLNSLGNRIFMLNTLNWMLDRSKALGVAPRPIEEYRLILGSADLARIRLWFFMMPAAISLLGIVILYARRR